MQAIFASIQYKNEENSAIEKEPLIKISNHKTEAQLIPVQIV